MFETITAAQWLDAGSKVLGGARQGGPSHAEATSYGTLDASGWVVDFGPGSASGGGVPSYWIVIAALAAWVIARRHST